MKQEHGVVLARVVDLLETWNGRWFQIDLVAHLTDSGYKATALRLRTLAQQGQVERRVVPSEHPQGPPSPEYRIVERNYLKVAP